jgi:hypothetical protein
VSVNIIEKFEDTKEVASSRKPKDQNKKNKT